MAQDRLVLICLDELLNYSAKVYQNLERVPAQKEASWLHKTEPSQRH